MVKRNDASGAADGTPVTAANSGSATADAFDVFEVGTYGSLTYDTHQGVKAIRATSTDQNGKAQFGWTLNPAQSRITGRVEMFLPAPGPGEDALWQYVEILSQGAWRGVFFTPGVDWLDDVPGGTIVATPRKLKVQADETMLVSADAVLPQDAWFRIEFDIESNSPNGSFEVRLYADRYTATPMQTWSAATGWRHTGSAGIDEIRFGAGQSLAASPGSVSLWFANVHISSDGTLPPPTAAPPAAPLMSTLIDTFATLSTVRWSAIGPVSVATGAVVLGDAAVTGYLTSVKVYNFNTAQMKILAPGRGCTLWIDADDATDFLKVVVSEDGSSIRAESSVSGSSAASGPQVFDLNSHRYVRIQRAGTTATFSTSGDGTTWATLWTDDLPDAALRRARAILTGDLSSRIDNFNVTVSPSPDPDPDPGPLPDPDPDPTYGDVDPFDPGAIAPEVPAQEAQPGGSPAPQCATALDLIREFSGLVKRAVRLTGPTSIEMVDPSLPLPEGWNAVDAPSLYSSTTHELTAGAKVLSLLAGDLAMSAGGTLVGNDARLLASTWRIPERLPVYGGLNPAPVKRVNMTFTPRSFVASVEFHVPSVPLEVRRT